MPGLLDLDQLRRVVFGGNLVIMRYLLAAFLVAMALQPIDLQGCAMDDGQQVSHHAAMQHGDDAPCCEADQEAPMKDCEGARHCGFVSISFLVIPPATAGVAALPAHYLLALGMDRYSGPPSPPLFRPPIA